MARYLYLKSKVLTSAGLLEQKIKARFIGLALLLAGLLVATTQLWPILYWHFYTLPLINSQKLLAPQPDWQRMQLQNITVKTDNDGFTYFVRVGDSKNLASGDQFFLTIPKLGIKDASVLINSQEFANNLAHFPGTALPGQEGNVFITGHSTLPQFFNPRDYKTIFSTLDKLEKEDTVLLKYHDKIYYYQITSRRVVPPDDISVLLPTDDFGKYLTLMTCVPPGLNTQRLIITGELREDLPRGVSFN